MLHGTCIQFHKFGNPKDVLQVEYKNIEPLKENEVLVRMLVRPINPSDLIPITERTHIESLYLTYLAMKVLVL